MEPVYDPIEVEERWQSTWAAERLDVAEPDSSRPDEGRRVEDFRGDALGGRFRP